MKKVLIAGAISALVSGCAGMAVSEAMKPQPVKAKPTGGQFANMCEIKAYNVKPKYPSEAARVYQDGWVLTNFDIDEMGKLVNLTVVDSSPAGVFEEAALKALVKGNFSASPAQTDCNYMMEFKIG